MNQTFRLRAPVYKEIIKALKPHVGSDGTRPVLAGVRVRYGRIAGQAVIEATNAVSLLRASSLVDIGTGDAFDVVVPGAEFMSLRPAKDADIDFTVRRSDFVDPTGEVGPFGYSEITDHTTTVRLEHVCLPAEYSDFDRLIGVEWRHGLTPEHYLMSTRVLDAVSKLPGRVRLRPTGGGKPILFWADGQGRDDYSPPEYQGAAMPCADDESEVPTWEDFQP